MFGLIDHNRFTEKMITILTESSSPASCLYMHCDCVCKHDVSLLFTPHNQHQLETRPAHRNVATSQTSEVVGRAPKNCNSYLDAIFKRHH